MPGTVTDVGLGVRSGHAMVVPYDVRWSAHFDVLAAIFRQRFGHEILGIEHVGSTAVPGLLAKPVLDVLVLVPDFESSRALEKPLESLGFEFRPEEAIPDRHFFRRKVGQLRTHHVSLAEPGSNYAWETLTFRDALRADPDLRGRYGRLKLQLAARFPRDMDSYIRGKTKFVRAVLDPKRAKSL